MRLGVGRCDVNDPMLSRLVLFALSSEILYIFEKVGKSLSCAFVNMPTIELR